MVNEQLLSFIRYQFSKGKIKEQIKVELITGGGWKEDEVEQAFAALGTPAPTASAPISNIYSPTSYVSNAAIAPAPKIFPYGIVGFISLLAFLGLAYTPFLQQLPQDARGKALLVLFGIGFAPVVTLYILTTLFKMPIRSWGKALFMVGLPIAIIAIVNVVTQLVGLGEVSGLVSVVIAIVIITGWVLLFAHIYQTRKWKAFWIGFWQLILSGIVTTVLFFIIGFSVLSSIANSIIKSNKSIPAEVPTEIPTIGSEYINKDDKVFTPEASSTGSSKQMASQPQQVNSKVEIDPKLFVPKGATVIESFYTDVNSNNKKEVWISYETAQEAGNLTYEYVNGDPQLKTSWKQVLANEGGSRILNPKKENTKIVYLNDRGNGPVLLITTTTFLDNGKKIVLWGIVNEKFETFAPYDLLMDVLPPYYEKYDDKNNDLVGDKVELINGEIVQTFLIINYENKQVIKTIKIHFIYKNNKLSVGQIEE